MIFSRKRPCPTASIATPMLIALWVVPLDLSLSCLFVSSHRPQPLPHPTSLAQPPTLPSHHPSVSTHSKQPSVATSTEGPAATPIINLSISATNATAEETTLALSALQYPNCNSILPILSPPSTPINIANLSTELEHNPHQQFPQAFYTPSNGAVTLDIPALAYSHNTDLNISPHAS